MRQRRHTEFSARPLARYYERLRAHFGPQHWWPGRSRFEIIVGAILTQNTSWGNVRKALTNLRRVRALTPRTLAYLPQNRLRALVRPSGYFRQKTQTLGAFLDYLGQRHGYSLERMFRLPTQELRRELLAVRGIGEETADSILLYAGNHALFVIDAYTRRVLLRHGLAPPKAPVAALRRLFEEQLPRRASLYNDYHALLVAAGKRYCHRHNPDCFACPLGPELEKGDGRA